MIERYGSLRPIPEASFQLPADLQYKVLFDCTRAAEQAGEVLPALNRTARFVNLLESSGISAGQAKLVVVMHGAAVPAALNAEAYRERFGRDNPNTDLIQELRRRGIEVHVCGQSFLGQGFEPDEIDPRIALAVSALAVLVAYQLRGFAQVSD